MAPQLVALLTAIHGNGPVLPQSLMHLSDSIVRMLQVAPDAAAEVSGRKAIRDYYEGNSGLNQ